MIKKCPKCLSISTKKDGKRNGYQSYKCKNCGHIFQNSRRIKSVCNNKLFKDYSVHKQTLNELCLKTGYSVSTIHRRITKILYDKYQESKTIRLNDNLPRYVDSVLILDATFFGKKGSSTQWGLLVAQDGITGDILASKHIFQETKEDYLAILRALYVGGYPKPLFAVIDGRNGVENSIQSIYDIPVQICQSHKIGTIDRYLLKYPRIESYRELKKIAHDMINTDRPTFEWMLEEFREKYTNDFKIRELDIRTLKYRYIYPRLHLAFKSIMRDIDRLFVSLDYLLRIKKNINTSNRVECVFSHLKPKVKLHRGLSKERRLSLALSLLWND